MNKVTRKKFIAVGWLTIASFCSTVIIAIIKHLNAKYSMHPFYIVALRNVFAFCIMLPMLFYKDKSFFQTNKLSLHALRAISGIFGMCLWFYCVTFIKLSDAVALTFFVPIFTAIFAKRAFNEVITAGIVRTLLIAVCGGLFIIRPSFEAFSHAYIIVIIVAATWSVSNVLVKELTKTESTQLILFYNLMFVMPVSVVLFILYYQPLQKDAIIWFIPIGLMSVIANSSLSNAYKNSHVGFLQPFDFMRLLFTVIVGYFAFGETISTLSAIGAAIIITNTIYFARTSTS